MLIYTPCKREMLQLKGVENDVDESAQKQKFAAFKSKQFAILELEDKNE